MNTLRKLCTRKILEENLKEQKPLYIYLELYVNVQYRRLAPSLGFSCDTQVVFAACDRSRQNSDECDKKKSLMRAGSGKPLVDAGDTFLVGRRIKL